MTTKYQVITSIADVKARLEQPQLNTQLVTGEIFFAEEDLEEYVKGYCEHDNTWGFVKKENLSTEIYTPTHTVNNPQIILQTTHKVQSEVTRMMHFGAKVIVTSEGEGKGDDGELFSQLSTGEWTMTTNLTPIEQLEKDYIKTARRFLHTPYRWGGRTSFGIDCSAFIQIALSAAGLSNIPKNSRIQSESDALGKIVTTPKKGDIVFFKGHVGIMTTDKNFLHAVGDRPRGGYDGRLGMRVREEPLEEALELLGKDITFIRRPKV